MKLNVLFISLSSFFITASPLILAQEATSSDEEPPASAQSTPDAPTSTEPASGGTFEKQLSMEDIKEAADSGDDRAQVELAKMYFRGGKGTPKDVLRGIEQLSKALKKNNPEAQTMMGACYYTGTGIPKDYFIALVWFQKAASIGYPQAFLCIYAMYRDGCGLPKNDELALQWLEKAVFAKSPDAMCEMALLKIKGRLGVRVNPEEARALLKKAKEAGSKRAAEMLQEIEKAKI
ncbi:MAG: tetratricopeptide repeat protein [Akkermansia sp.]